MSSSEFLAMKEQWFYVYLWAMVVTLCIDCSHASGQFSLGSPVAHFTSRHLETANPIFVAPSSFPTGCKIGGSWERPYTHPGFSPQHVPNSEAGFRACAAACTRAGKAYFGMSCPVMHVPEPPNPNQWGWTQENEASEMICQCASSLSGSTQVASALCTDPDPNHQNSECNGPHSLVSSGVIYGLGGQVGGSVYSVNPTGMVALSQQPVAADSSPWGCPASSLSINGATANGTGCEGNQIAIPGSMCTVVKEGFTCSAVLCTHQGFVGGNCTAFRFDKVPLGGPGACLVFLTHDK